jgi:hypothetical protein
MPKRILTLIGLGLLISMAILVVCTHAPAEENKDEKRKEESSKLGERRVRLPRVSFPPSDPTGEAGYLPLFRERALPVSLIYWSQASRFGMLLGIVNLISCR